LGVFFCFPGVLRVDGHCEAMRGSLRSAVRRGARPTGVSRLSPPGIKRRLMPSFYFLWPMKNEIFLFCFSSFCYTKYKYLKISCNFR